MSVESCLKALAAALLLGAAGAVAQDSAGEISGMSSSEGDANGMLGDDAGVFGTLSEENEVEGNWDSEGNEYVITTVFDETLNTVVTTLAPK